MSLAIRDAGAADGAAFRRLWAGFLAHYDMALPEEVTALTWARILDPASPMALRLAEVGGHVAGFALYQHHPSSWVAGDDCYLEDLYVDPAFRGQGLGAALIGDLKAIARARGWKRLYWMTDLDNTTARRLYDRMAPCDNHVRYRVTV
jgi:GNAT superfamily N-acetyltransferase